MGISWKPDAPKGKGQINRPFLRLEDSLYCLINRPLLRLENITCTVFNPFRTFAVSAEHLLRTDPSDGMEGFFIALFVRRKPNEVIAMRNDDSIDTTNFSRGKSFRQIYFPRMSKMFLYYASQMKRDGQEACGTCHGCSGPSCC